jgi:hypothetical protein
VLVVRSAAFAAKEGMAAAMKHLMAGEADALLVASGR